MIDIHLAAQTALYFFSIGTGLVTSVPTGITQNNFAGQCILYGNVQWENATYFTYTTSDPAMCRFVVMINVIACIFFALGMGIYYAYGVHRSRLDTSIATQMWVMPFILTCSLICVLTFVSSCFLSVGFAQWCSSFLAGRDVDAKINTCADGQNTDIWNWNVGDVTVSGSTYYKFLTVAQSTSWIGFLTWIAQLALTLLRMVRNRKTRSQDAFVDASTRDTTPVV